MRHFRKGDKGEEKLVALHDRVDPSLLDPFVKLDEVSETKDSRAESILQLSKKIK